MEEIQPILLILVFSSFSYFLGVFVNMVQENGRLTQFWTGALFSHAVMLVIGVFSLFGYLMLPGVIF